MLRLRELRREKGITQSKLAESLGLSRSTIAMYETDGSEPDIETLFQLASFFDVSVDYLTGREKKYDNVAPMSLDRNAVRIPVYGSIPAGVPIEMVADTYIDDYEDIPADWLKGNQQYFCLKVKGDSMSPKFEDGDILILRQQPSCESGDYCAISINGTECTFKKVLINFNGLTLQPLNPKYEPKFFSNAEVAKLPITILGVVKEVRRGL